MMFSKLELSKLLKATLLISLFLLFCMATSQAQVRSTSDFLPSIISILLTDGNCNASEEISPGVTLVTQSDVTALEGVTNIQGDLILAPSSANTDFSPLSSLKEVSGNFVFANSNVGTDVVGFDCLETIGGEVDTSAGITLEFLDSDNFTPSQQQAFHDALRRWEDILEGTSLENVFITGSSSAGCSISGKPTFVGNLHIQVASLASDGAGGIKTRAAPTRLRAGSFLPFAGCLEIDLADLPELESNGTLEDTLIQEMAHILGFGTLWEDLGLIINPLPNSVPNQNIPQPMYIGTNAVDQWNNIGGIGNVPVENGLSNGMPNGAGPGEVNEYWDKDAFENELMTFTIDSNDVEFPLSLVTLGSLEDLGYQVDYTLADSFTLPQ